MYRRVLENLSRMGGQSQPQTEQPKGLVAPKQLEEPAYNPLNFLQNSMQRIKEMRIQGRQRIEAEERKQQSKKAGTETGASWPFVQEVEADPKYVGSFGKEGQLDTDTPRKSLMRRPNPKSGDGFLGLIDQHEGGGDYGALLGFSNRDRFSNVDITNMTLAELNQFARTEYGQYSKEWKASNNHGNPSVPSTPMGRYQFVNTTLQSQARKLGLDPHKTKFTPEVQDRLFESYLQDRLNRADTMEGKVRQLRNAWEGFVRVPTPRLEAAIRQYEGVDV